METYPVKLFYHTSPPEYSPGPDPTLIKKQHAILNAPSGTILIKINYDKHPKIKDNYCFDAILHYNRHGRTVS